MPETLRSSNARSLPGWTVGLALAWLIVYGLFFFSFTLPNNPNVSRLDIWLALPELLQANLLPAPPEVNALPSGGEYLPQRFDLMLVAGVILSGAWGLGHLVLRVLSLPGRDRWSRLSSLPLAERTVFAFGLGLSGLSLLTLGCGLAGQLSRPLFGGLLAGLVLLEIALRFRRGSNQHTETPPQSPRVATRGIAPLCLLIMVPFLLAMLLGSMLPPVDFDVKEYHLQGPKEFFQNGRITFLPHNVYTSFPFLTEMLSLLAMVLRDDWYRGALAGKAVLMSFAPLTALALYAAGRRWFSPTVGWLAATVHLTTPWVYRISIIAYAEGGLTFYLFATLLAVMLVVETLRDNSHSSSLVPRPSSLVPPCLLAGLLAGSAMACKYPGVLQVVIPMGGAVALAPFVCQKGGEQRAKSGEPEVVIRSRCSGSSLSALRSVLFGAGIFGMGVLLTVGPWLLKNTVETGNPVYPLMYTVFGGRDWDPELNAKWRAAHSPDTHALSDLGVKFVDVTAKSDWLSPLLFALAPLALLFGRNKNAARWLWLYAAFLFLAWWTFTHRIDRFWVPMIPVVSLLAGIGAGWTADRRWRVGCTAFMATAILFNLAFVTTRLCGFNAYLADLNAAGWAAESTAPGIASLNERLPEGAKVLCVGNAQVFDARFPLVYNTVFDADRFQQWCAGAQPGVPADRWSLKPATAIRRTFQEHGITHVFVNWQELLRYRTTYAFISPARGERTPGYTQFITPKLFAELQRQDILEPPRLLTFPETFPGVPYLSENSQRELRSWAPELVVTVRGTERMIPMQVFHVKR